MVVVVVATVLLHWCWPRLSKEQVLLVEFESLEDLLPVSTAILAVINNSRTATTAIEQASSRSHRSHGVQ